MSNQSSSSNGGISFAGLLTVLFIGLKLTHYIDWSWWYILAPLYVGVPFMIVVSLFTLFSVGFIAGCFALVNAIFKRRKSPFKQSLKDFLTK